MWSDLAQRAEAVITRKAELDFTAVAGVDPSAAFRRFGASVATRLPVLPQRVPYNKVRGYRSADHRMFDEVIGFYADTDVRPALEVWAGDATTGLHRALLDAGLAPAAPTVTLHARPAPAAPGSAVVVQEVGLGDERYLDVLYGGYEALASEVTFRKVLAIEHATPGLRRYVALVDGHPAAAGALFTHGGVSYFAGAATLPDFRRRGCQAALINRRLADAREESDLVVVTAAYASPSHDNLARHGFGITHTRTVWR
ncbi:GNAT family N-acetyltransferase [Glycomyces xiaoerkulensis]|uniref:GNAT family N-acetyltransferase n=1 Tax=Glycomyces xiaoerkulensis TaxID=2038139 RepID=UPI000C258BF9|nr:GNAT family N-acetyltransferase [Glycomyces xiaoerkulensis]